MFPIKYQSTYLLHFQKYNSSNHLLCFYCLKSIDQSTRLLPSQKHNSSNQLLCFYWRKNNWPINTSVTISKTQFIQSAALFLLTKNLWYMINQSKYLLLFQKHDSSNHLLCFYCLRTFEVKFVSQGWGQTQTFYGHLLKHQSKSNTKKCGVCRLTFFNAQDVKNHRKLKHLSSNKNMQGKINKLTTDLVTRESKKHITK